MIGLIIFGIALGEHLKLDLAVIKTNFSKTTCFLKQVRAISGERIFVCCVRSNALVYFSRFNLLGTGEEEEEEGRDREKQYDEI